jgi:ComF family protein
VTRAHEAGISSWRRSTRRALDTLFPPRCAGCAARGHWLCDSCLRRIEPTPLPICGACVRPVAPDSPHGCRVAAGPVTISAVGLHAGPLRKAVHVLKYGGRFGIAAVLAEILAPVVSPLCRPDDLLAPVPLHPAKERERGYNQSAVLGAELARLLGVEWQPAALQRTRDTDSQATLPAHARAANVLGAFTARQDLVSGRRVWLVDDVCTTGSTLGACTLALRQAGGREIRATVVAVAASSRW